MASHSLGLIQPLQTTVTVLGRLFHRLNGFREARKSLKRPLAPREKNSDPLGKENLLAS